MEKVIEKSMRKAVSKRIENAEEQQNLDGGVLMMERCPKCGSSQVKTKNTIVERGFAVCYVDYCECQKCGNVWEPKRTIEVRLSWKNWDIPPLNVPDGSTVRITYPDGYTWDAKLTYLDPTHFQVNGNTYHKDQFAEMLDRAPGTKVELVDGAESKSKNKKLLRSRSKSNPRYYVAGYYDDRCTGLAEDYKVDSIDEVESHVWDMLNHGFVVKVEDTKTGASKIFDSNDMDEYGPDLSFLTSKSVKSRSTVRNVSFTGEFVVYLNGLDKNDNVVETHKFAWDDDEAMGDMFSDMIERGLLVEVDDRYTGAHDYYWDGGDGQVLRCGNRRSKSCAICGQPMGATPSYSKWDPKQRVCANCRNRQEQEDYLNGVVTYSKKGRFFVWMKRGGKE